MIRFMGRQIREWRDRDVGKQGGIKALCSEQRDWRVGNQRLDGREEAVQLWPGEPCVCMLLVEWMCRLSSLAGVAHW